MSTEDVKGAIAAAREVPPAIPPADNRELAMQPRNDIGNGQRLLARHGADLIDVAEAGWHVWASSRWEMSVGQRGGPGPDVLRRAHETAKAIEDEAEALGKAAPPLPPADDNSEEGKAAIRRYQAWIDRTQKHHKWCISSGNQARIEAMLKTAAPYRRRRPEELDAQPFVFNVANGTLALDGEQVELRPHRREDLCTHISPVVFDPQASCPMFRRFLDTVQPDDEAQKFLQVWAGYNMSGLTVEQVLTIHYGTGANGKGVFLSALSQVMGDYAAVVPIETFMVQRMGRDSSGATPDIARLPGKRVTIASEPDAGARLSEGLVKVATGGGKMTARRLFEGQFEFSPVFKLNIDTNAKPVIRGQDEGIWRRVLLLPWNVFIPEAQRVRDLAEQLRAEASGILNWVLDGWRIYRERGSLYLPDIVLEATRQYRTESDPLRQFVVARLRRVPGVRVLASRVYGAYEAWCKDNALEPISGNLFGRRLTALGIEREIIGVTFYLHHELIEAAEQSGGMEDSGGGNGPMGPDPPPV